MKAREETSQSV